MVVCVAMQLGKHHDWVLDELDIPQVFLHWENIGVVQGYGKPSGSQEAARRDEPEFVWDRAKREFVEFREEDRERYSWNEGLRIWER
jgi:hypothetical protein